MFWLRADRQAVAFALCFFAVAAQSIGTFQSCPLPDYKLQKQRQKQPFFEMIGYARVSTTEQETELQLVALRSAGCNKIYVEKISSVARKRPMLNKALSECVDGKTLVVYKLDRLARSLIDLLRIIGKLNDSNAHLRSLTEPIDTTTATGVLMLQILGAFAEFERNLISERTKAGMEVARISGKQIGAKRRYTSAQAKHCLALRDSGSTYKQICQETGLSFSQVQRLCSNNNL